jgi:uncharacterized membrane protein
MNNELKELIQMSCLSGNIGLENRILIYKKAEEVNISKEECDVYISGFLTKANNEYEKSNKKTHIYGYLLYFTAFWDIFWAMSLLDHQYTRGYGITLLCFGAIIFYFSFRLMKKNSMTTKVLGIILLAGITYVFTVLIFNSLFGIRNNGWIGLLSLFLLIGIIIICRRFFLTEKIAKKLDLALSKK